LTINPTIENNKTTNGTAIGPFESSITGLNSGTTYYIRAYATNKAGTGYGSSSVFTTLNNPLDVKTAYMPAGTYTMGSATNPKVPLPSETPHQVTLSAFLMSKYEITNTQYSTFLNKKGVGSDGIYSAGAYPTKVLIYASSGESDWGIHYVNSKWVPVSGYENYPIIFVTWWGAMEFANYVGGRLPTESQWEYACRAGTVSPFNTGTCLSNEQANYDWSLPYGVCKNTVSTSLGKTQAVGSYSPNAWGLYDMHGNVSEWCYDAYDDYPTTPQIDPQGPIQGNAARMIRGGSWSQSADICRSAARFFSGNGYYDYNGFRVVFVP